MSSCCNNGVPTYVRWDEDSSATIMARLTARPTTTTAEGTPLVQSDVSTISITVWDITGGAVNANYNALALTVSAVMFNTLQGWHVDTTGFNFSYTIGSNGFPTGDSKYRVEVKFTLASGFVGHVVWEGPANKLYGS